MVAAILAAISCFYFFLRHFWDARIHFGTFCFGSTELSCAPAVNCKNTENKEAETASENKSYNKL